MHHKAKLATSSVLLATLMVGALLTSAPAQAQNDQRCFPETGQCISGRIRSFWEQNGGLPVFGFPLTPQQEETIEGKALQVQWFERNRLELHPENQPPYDVLIGRVGVDALTKQGRDWQAFPKPAQSEIPDTAECRLFAETGFTVCGAFLQAYRSYGLVLPNASGVTFAESLALWGLPISAPISETLSDGREYRVQWFERARFELHPENQPPYNVLFGRLGAELHGQSSPPASANPLADTEWRLVSFGPANAPTPASTSSPAMVTFRGDGRLSGMTGCNSINGPYQVQGDRINAGPIVSTLRACIDETVAQQEKTMLDVLGNAPRFELANNQLKLFSSQGTTMLTFEPNVSAQRAMVSGTISYRQRIALPPNAVATIDLADISRADAPATIIGTQVISPAGQVPIAFSINYDPSQINQAYTYAIQARIEADGRLLFRTTTAYLVITQGRPNTIDVLLEQISS